MLKQKKIVTSAGVVQQLYLHTTTFSFFFFLLLPCFPVFLYLFFFFFSFSFFFLMVDKKTRPSSPTSTTPLLSETTSTTATHGSNTIGSIGSPTSPRHNSVHRVPTFMQTSVPSRRSIIKAFLDMTMHMMFELALPIILYYALRTQFSPIISLIAAGIPPALVVVVKGVRDHKVDMMGLLMLLGFAASVLLALVESDPKLYLLRESAMTSAMGIMLMVTLFPLRWRHRILRPFMFYVARQIAVSSTTMLPPETVRLHWDWFWTNWLSFRTFFRKFVVRKEGRMNMRTWNSKTVRLRDVCACVVLQQ